MQPAMQMAAKGVIVATSPADSSGTAPSLAGPFTLREVVVMAGALLLLIGSVLPFQVGNGSYVNVWTFHTTAFNQFVTLALPLVIGGAFAWRRAAGRTHVTAGSLTLDQLASVVSLLGILYFFISSVMSMNPAFLLGLLGSLVMAGGTAAAPYIPGFVLDFAPGEGALLTRPIRPSAARGSSSATAHTAEAAHAPETGATPTVATGLAASHSTTPEPAPGDWPRPGAAEEAAAANAPADSADDATAEATSSPGRETTTGDTVGTASDTGTGAPAAEDTDGTGSADDTAAGATAADAAREPSSANRESAAPVPTGEATTSPPTTSDERAGAKDDAPEAKDAPQGNGAPDGNGAPEEQVAEELSFTATSSGRDAPAQQAFWFAVPDRRTAVNEATGRNAFVLEPGEWVLALEDRGYEFLVQHADGSVGVLRDLGRIERA